MPPARPDSPVGSVVGRASRLVGPPRGSFSGSSPLAEARLFPEDTAAQALSGAKKEARRQAGALEALLADLGSQIQRGPSREAAEPARFFSTGMAELDASLGGGFPCGRISEICGAPSSGRTALAFRLVQAALATTQAATGAQPAAGASPAPGAQATAPFVSWVDLADAFDPPSAAQAGIELERVLWIRPRDSEEALRSCDRLLQTEGFGLVLFDSIPPSTSSRHAGRPIRDADWLRLSRLTARTRTALVVLSEGEHPATGSRAEIVLEMRPSEVHFGASAGQSSFKDAPNLLETVETQTVLRRHRSKPSGVRVHLRLEASQPLETC